MDTRSPIVELRGVVKRFGQKTVLPGLDLSVFEGELLTLLGPSGCGKTTILRLTVGFEAPEAGEILLDGQRVNDVPPQRLTRGGKKSLRSKRSAYTEQAEAKGYDALAAESRALQGLSREIAAAIQEESRRSGGR